jgi:hypothetical protein
MSASGRTQAPWRVNAVRHARAFLQPSDRPADPCRNGILLHHPTREILMDAPVHSTAQLFAQLGLPSDPGSIYRFIDQHRPLPDCVKLSEAPFWTPSQAAFLREGLQADADWAQIIDTLNAALHEATDQPALSAPCGTSD